MQIFRENLGKMKAKAVDSLRGLLLEIPFKASLKMDLERNMVIQELNSEGGGLSMDMWLKELISTKLWRKVY